MKRLLLLIACTGAHPLLGFGQQGVGFRIGAGFMHVADNRDQPLVTGSFSALQVGAFYQHFRRNGGGEIGLNLLLKNQEGGFNLPLVMRDFEDGQNTALTSIEIDGKVGPKFGWLHPQLGLVAGYRLRSAGVLTADAPEGYALNRVYLNLPIGVLLNLPTQFGTVGVGVHYQFGLTNIIRNPVGGSTGWEGGTLRSVNVALHILFGNPEP